MIINWKNDSLYWTIYQRFTGNQKPYCVILVGRQILI